MSSRNVNIELLPGEYWWGGAVVDGVCMPFGLESFKRSLDPNNTANQANPIYISNKGRFIWSERPFEVLFMDGRLIANSKKADIEFGDGYENLRGVYLEANARFFSPKGLLPDELLFTAPQYNTWIELKYDQEQKKILDYAESIINNGMPPGVFMIDDNWQENYGVWSFHQGRFKSPKKMIERLHELGFKVMLWVCPFVSSDSETFRKLRDKALLIRGTDGAPVIRNWWNGYSAVLDLTNEETVQWFKGQLHNLIAEYGVDGFKFDAGDPIYYSTGDICKKSSLPEDQCEAYSKIGTEFKLNEYRMCWKMAGEPLAQRLCDKKHSWDIYGIGSLIPNGIAQGLMGYAFTCPDMIGGGEITDFLPGAISFDDELFVRYAQCSALFPMMQFSAAPWRMLDKEKFGYCLDAANLHKKLGNEILELARNAALTGEPIMRHMAYDFPECGFEEIRDQFMLGKDILVAPVVKKGAALKNITFPSGKWFGDDGSIVEGPCTATVNAPLSRLPWYRKTY